MELICKYYYIKKNYAFINLLSWHLIIIKKFIFGQSCYKKFMYFLIFKIILYQKKETYNVTIYYYLKDFILSIYYYHL